MVKGFQDLEVWKKAHRVTLDIYRVTIQFPRTEQFGVISQLRRAAYSIPANIAEGSGRRSTKELLHFLALSNGSLEELRYFLLLSRDLRYLPSPEHDRLQSELKSVAEMLEALARSLRRRLSSSDLPPSPSPRDTGHGTRTARLGVAHE
jgi:four helix bundle protein